MDMSARGLLRQYRESAHVVLYTLGVTIDSRDQWQRANIQFCHLSLNTCCDL